MCGICGIVHKDNAPVEKTLLERMNTALFHRGPDGDGYYLDAGIGLAMRRLAIIDLNSGDQPITNEERTLWIVFNGEIYNFHALRADLQKRGHRFSTNSDTECIIHLYEEYGVTCLEHLRGMFAFALWDAGKQALFIARDRLGKKPLYYTIQDGTLYFASELSGLLVALPHKPPVDMQAIDMYLGLQYIPEPFSAYEGIRKLPPAHYLLWERGKAHIERYWQIEYLPKHSASEETLIEELRGRLHEAVRLRLISDVPLGAHLSGGLDSSIIVALMAQAGHGPVKTFSVGFEEESFSELPYSRAVAQQYATEHQEFILSYGDIPATLEKMAVHFGEPFADPSALPLYHLSRLTRQYVTVALNGDGGDENFAGYTRYWLDPWADRYLRLPSLLTQRLIPFILHLIPDRANRPIGADPINGLKRLAQLPHIDRRASILRWGSYFSFQQRCQLWRPEYQQSVDADKAEALLVAHFVTAEGSFLDRTLFTDLHTYLPGDLLVKADRMTMANSLEARSPFLDHEIIEWCARLPDTLKVRGSAGKYLLKRAFERDLPEKVHSHRKQGFGIPVSDWLRGPLSVWSRQLIQEHLTGWFEPSVLGLLFEEHASGRVDHGKRLWALAMLATWKKSLHNIQ